MLGLKQRKIKQLEEREVQLNNRIIALLNERDKLTDNVSSLRQTNKELQHKRKINEEDIAHKIRMREETCDVNYQKKEQKLRGELEKEKQTIREEYQKKTEEHLEKRYKEVISMYETIVERLPDVNLKLKG